MEFALLIPVFVLALWILVAMAVGVATYIEVVQASRNAARAAVISDPDDVVAQSAAAATTNLGNVTVAVRSDGSYLTATVRGSYSLPLPLPRRFRPRITMSSSTTMMTEPLLDFSLPSG